MLIWTNFDGFAITYLISAAYFKKLFSTSSCAYFFANTKGPETSFQIAVFVEFFGKNFSFVIWTNFFNRLCLLLKFKLFSKIYF